MPGETRAAPVRLAAQTEFLKDEVFAVCGALALGESLLRRLGWPAEADHLASVFDLVEGRLGVVQPSDVADSEPFDSASLS